MKTVTVNVSAKLIAGLTKFEAKTGIPVDAMLAHLTNPEMNWASAEADWELWTSMHTYADEAAAMAAAKKIGATGNRDSFTLSYFAGREIESAEFNANGTPALMAA